MADLNRAARRVAIAGEALRAFGELLPLPVAAEVQRDAAIQRFEFTLEAVWKAAKAVLEVCEGVVVATPKAAVRGSHDAGWLSVPDADAAFDAVDDRNLTSHTYDRSLAEALGGRLPRHHALLARWHASLVAALAPQIPA